ncbi:hypothetical protein [Ornithinimicrobium sp. LYQ103]
MSRLTKSVIIDAPVEDVVDHLTDPARSWVDVTSAEQVVEPGSLPLRA